MSNVEDLIKHLNAEIEERFVKMSDFIDYKQRVDTEFVQIKH